MVALLADAKRQALAAQGRATVGDFERAWDEAWAVMVAERAWPHAVEQRRQWRVAMLATKSEARAAFVGRQTVFGSLADSFAVAAERMQRELPPEHLPALILGAIGQGFTLTEDDDEQPDHEDQTTGVAA